MSDPEAVTVSLHVSRSERHCNVCGGPVHHGGLYVSALLPVGHRAHSAYRYKPRVTQWADLCPRCADAFPDIRQAARDAAHRWRL